MTDEEILARLPSGLHPYLVRPLALRLLRPVELGTPEFHFAVGLLYIIANQPERWPSRMSDYIRLDAQNADRAFIRRCQRVIQHLEDKIRWRTALLLKRLDQADDVFRLIEEDALDPARLPRIPSHRAPTRQDLKRLYGSFYEWLLARFDEWDPLGIVFETNQGEYGPEVSHIMPLLRSSQSADDLTEGIHAIFVQMFDADMAGPMDTYKPFAREIIVEWQKQRGAVGS